MTDRDLAIVGSGFGGSILAMIARRLGLSVVLLERGRHPRFAIGESASPLAGILIEQLADRYDLPRLRPLSAFGTWQRAYPEIGCGLKRGFTYFKHQEGQRYRVAPGRANQLLVAASPNDELSDTHWLRADVDHFLQREAVALGAEYLDEAELDAMRAGADGSWHLTGARRGTPVNVRARFVVDASGPRGFISKALGIENIGFEGYPATQALFSHFTGVARCADLPDFCTPAPRRPSTHAPFPPDDAALHHVFDEGWMWVLRFGNGVTSAGIAVTDRLAAELRIADGEPAWRRFFERYPSIAAQFAEATAIRQFTWMPRMAWRAREAAGPGWAMLPSAAGFVDPLFSTGIPLTLLGIERLAAQLPALIDQSGTTNHQPITNHQSQITSEYAALTLADVDHTAAFVGGCYAAFPDFDRFTAYSMIYFVAASYSEMARRVDAPSRPRRFLCADHPTLGPAVKWGRESFEEDTLAYAEAIRDAVEQLNVAGLCEAGKDNWYGVDLEDTVRGAGKLGVSETAVREMLARSGCPV